MKLPCSNNDKLFMFPGSCTKLRSIAQTAGFFAPEEGNNLGNNTDGHFAHRGLATSCRLEQGNRQRQSYDRATLNTIRNPGRSAVRMDDCFDKGKTQTVPGRMLPFHEALESPA